MYARYIVDVAWEVLKYLIRNELAKVFANVLIGYCMYLSLMITVGNQMLWRAQFF